MLMKELQHFHWHLNLTAAKTLNQRQGGVANALTQPMRLLNRRWTCQLVGPLKKTDPFVSSPVFGFSQKMHPAPSKTEGRVVGCQGRDLVATVDVVSGSHKLFADPVTEPA